MKKLVVLTGAGMSVESGLSTFRGGNGMWDNYPVMDVASVTGFRRNPALVHEFYNIRRHELINVKPNAGHYGLVDLESKYDVKIITQNVDNLHEQAGSKSVLHLHGELMKVRAVDNENLVYTLTKDNLDTTPETIIDGHHVRPHIVFFEESVPMFEPAIEIVQDADIVVVIGTSLQVYPAASLINYARKATAIYYIDPAPAHVPDFVTVIPKGATEGVKELKKLLM